MSEFGQVGDGSFYLPVYALPYWGHLAPFVNAIVNQCQGELNRDRDSLYAALTPFVLWCWRARGYELTTATIFRAAAIEQFIHRGAAHYAPGTRSTLRGTLWRVLEVVAPQEANRRRRPISRIDPTLPYSTREVAALHSWARSQRTSHRQLDALALIGLGFGAGLPTRELLRVTADHCAVSSDGSITVNVEGSRRRDVQLLPEWQSTLRQVIDARSGRMLFRPDRVGPAEGQVSDFVLRSRTALDVKPVRMRTTWLVAHLAAGTDPSTLKRLSGLNSLAALDRILIFVPSSGALSGPKTGGFATESSSDQEVSG